MPKLPPKDQFLDLSDYGRPIAQYIAHQLKNSGVTPIHITICFSLSGILAVMSILNHQYIMAAFFLILKSVLDAADGELARIRDTPSHVGRYLDSISDLLLNLLLFLALWTVSDSMFIFILLAFLSLQLQGTLYNFYYVIIRNKAHGDITSQIFEIESPKAYPGEQQELVDRLHKIYRILYGGFDQIIYALDRDAFKCNHFPPWFMTCLSIFGLGFQLLVIAAMLVLGMKNLIVPLFIGITTLLPLFILERKKII
ncbi:MAG: CDP-alcohol phosphatidyltransferase family protein [Saprospiraceae bacterium]|nr:CDP-alcohol phosphatidyltransferase family protein [Saprospiraceae bacterium]